MHSDNLKIGMLDYFNELTSWYLKHSGAYLKYAKNVHFNFLLVYFASIIFVTKVFRQAWLKTD